MTIRFAFFAAAAIGSFTIFAGCAAPADSTEASVEARADGLTVAEANESTRTLIVKFRKDGREITFDMRLGEKMEQPTEDAEKLGLPTRMNDARILDAAGQAFYMQMGADEFIDHAWRAPKAENIDEAGRLTDIQAARDSESEWRTLTLPSWAEDLRLSAMDIARSFDTIRTKDGVAQTQPTVPSDGSGALQPKATLAYGTTSVVKWDYMIKEKDAFVSNFGLVDHSAVILRGWSSTSSVLYTAISCNHGACANSTAMTRSCTMTGYRTDDGTHSRYFYNELNADGNTAVSSGCSTAYSALWDNGAHVCNDDTLLQRNAIYYDSSYDRSVGPIGYYQSGMGTCADNTKPLQAPSCQ